MYSLTPIFYKLYSQAGEFISENDVDTNHYNITINGNYNDDT